MEDAYKKINVQELNNLEKDIDKFISNQRPNILMSIKEYFQELVKVFCNKYVFVFAISYITSFLFLLKILEPIVNWLRIQSNLNHQIVKYTIIIISGIVLLTILFSLLFLLISSIIVIFKNEKKTIISKDINELIDNDGIIRLAIYISRKYRISTIKIQEERLRYKIVMLESYQTKAIISLPLLIVCFLFLFEYIFGVSVDSFILNFSQKVKGTLFIAFVTTVLTTIIKSDYINPLTYQKQALSALKQAQILLVDENS